MWYLCKSSRYRRFFKGLNVFISNQEYANKSAEEAKQRVNKLYVMPVVWEQLVNIWDN